MTPALRPCPATPDIAPVELESTLLAPRGNCLSLSPPGVVSQRGLRQFCDLSSLTSATQSLPDQSPVTQAAWRLQLLARGWLSGAPQRGSGAHHLDCAAQRSRSAAATLTQRDSSCSGQVTEATKAARRRDHAEPHELPCCV